MTGRFRPINRDYDVLDVRVDFLAQKPNPRRGQDRAGGDRVQRDNVFHAARLHLGDGAQGGDVLGLDLDIVAVVAAEDGGVAFCACLMRHFSLQRRWLASRSPTSGFPKSTEVVPIGSLYR